MLLGGPHKTLQKQLTCEEGNAEDTKSVDTTAFQLSNTWIQLSPPSVQQPVMTAVCAPTNSC